MASLLLLQLQLPHSSGYHRLCISCNQFVQPVTQLFNPMSKSHKKNAFPLLSSTYDLEEFKLHRRERQHKYCGLRNDEQYGEESMSLSYLNYKAEKWHPSEMEGHFGRSFSRKCLNASKDHLWMRSTGQICADLVGRRCFLKLSSICLVTCLTVYANPASAEKDEKSFYDEKRLLEQNKRIQKANGAPPDFPNFIREGFDVKVVTSDNYVRCDSGLIYWDIREGEGDYPKTGQQVIFNYQGYNESGRRIDSNYQQGEPAKTRVGINGLVPGVEEGIQTMKPGGKRRIIVPPELGPPSKYETLKIQVKLLQVHLEKAEKSINAAIALKQTVVRLNKENNALKHIIKQHGMDPNILLKAKEVENPSLLSPGDALKEDEAILHNLNLAVEDLISSGIIEAHNS